MMTNSWVNSDIKMEFGLEKCAKATLKRGRLASSSNIHIDNSATIKELEQEGTYNYLGIQHATMMGRESIT